MPEDGNSFKKLRSDFEGCSTNLLAHPSSTLLFSQNFESKQYKIIEASESVLKSVENNESVYLKGNEGSNDAVLVTSNKTFALKKVETSNTVFLVPPAKGTSFQIESKASEYYELKAIEPSFEILRQVLIKTEYNGCEEERTNPPDPSNLYTRGMLESLVLASSEEMFVTLDELGVVEINGFVRMVAIKAIRNVNAALIDAIIEKDWNIDAIEKRACLEEIPDVDDVLLGKVMDNLGKSEDGHVWNLSLAAIQRAMAHVIFNDTTSSSVSGCIDR